MATENTTNSNTISERAKINPKLWGVSQAGYGTLQLNWVKHEPKAWLHERSLHTIDEYFDAREHLLETFVKGELAENPEYDLDNRPKAVCYYCGFPDDVYLEIDHLDNDHSNYNSDNLVLCCSLCHRTKHLGWTAMNNLAELVYIPLPNDEHKDVFKVKKAGVLELLNIQQRFDLATSFRSAKENKDLTHVLLNEKLRNNNVFIGANTEGNDHNANAKMNNTFQAADDIAQAQEKQELAESQMHKDTLDYKNFNQNVNLFDFLLAYDAAIASGTGINYQNFITIQESVKDKALFALSFNTAIYAPFHEKLWYTLEERMEYYRKLEFLTVKQLSHIMQNKTF